jgi:hypothetical protein
MDRIRGRPGPSAVRRPKKKMAAASDRHFPYAKKRYKSFTEIYGTRVRVTRY